MRQKTMLALFLVAVLFAGTMLAITRIYNGPAGGDWHNPANWNPAGVPGTGDQAVVNYGSTVDAGDAGIDVQDIINDGTINNPGDLNTSDFFSNRGIINNAGNINAGVFINDTSAQINGAKNINVNGNDFDNRGLIQGAPGATLNIKVNISDSLGRARNTPEGVINGDNVNIDLRAGDLDNQGVINAQGNLFVKAWIIKNQLWARLTGKSVRFVIGSLIENKGDLSSTGGTSPDGMGNNIDIVAMNRFVNGTFVNSGNILGGNGDPGYGGDNININADNFSNTGTIQAGENGTGTGVYGGNVTANVRDVLLFNGGCVCALDRPDGSTTVAIISDKVTLCTYRPDLRSSADALLKANFINLVGREIVVEDIPDSSVMATDYLELISTNAAGNIIDFSDVTQERVFVTNPTGSILIQGDNLIAPPIGYNAMCEPDPTVSTGSIPRSDVTIVGEMAMSFTGHSDSLEVLIRNEYTASRTFNYSITSLLGWFAPVTGTTPTLAPWETHSFYVHFTIPSGFGVTVTDSVTSAVMGTLYPIKRWVSPIIAFPFDTLHYLAVDEARADMPDNFSLSAFPNPFNSAVRITIDGAAICHSRESGNPERVAVEIFDIAGRRVAQLPDRGTVGAYGIRPKNGSTRLTPTDGVFVWTPDESLPSGVYLVRATFPQQTASAVCTKRVVFLK